LEKQITIYTLKNCPICKFLKGELEGRKREYNEIEIEDNNKIGDNLEYKFGTTTYPIFQISDRDTVLTFLRETDLESPKNVIIFDVNNIINILDQYEI